MTATGGERSSSTIREETRPGGATTGPATAGFWRAGDDKAAPPAIDRQTLTVEEAAVLLGIGRNSAYQAIARGELPALRLGRRLLVPRTALARHLAESGAVERDAPGGRHA